MVSTIFLPRNPVIASKEWHRIILLQFFFLLVALPGLNAPFTSVHYVRQNHTFDIAHHIFKEGWPAVWAPRATFSLLPDPNHIFSDIPASIPRFTIVYLEFPFYGVLGWPMAHLFPDDERAIVRLIAVFFGISSNVLFFLIVRRWADALAALIGTVLWTTSPLVLHFGQVPMPDILAVTGIAGAFLLALRGNLSGSSAAFLFAVMAKMSILIYGLPILVALVLALRCGSLGAVLKISVLWGAAPLLAVTGWLLLASRAPSLSWTIFGDSTKGHFDSLHMAELLNWRFYLLAILHLIPFGCGILGVTGLLFTLLKRTFQTSFWLIASVLVAIIANYVCENIIFYEAQYTIPVVFWLLLGATPGLSVLLEKARASWPWRISILVLFLFHFLLVGVSVTYLKSSRVFNFDDLQSAGKLLPSDARVIVYSTTANTYLSVWLNRNTAMVLPLDDLNPSPLLLNRLNLEIDKLRQAGFGYLMVVDTQRSRSPSFLWHEPSYATDYTSSQSPIRRDFDDHFLKLFEGNHVVLYALPGPK